MGWIKDLFSSSPEKRFKLENDLDFIIVYLEKCKRLDRHPDEIPEIVLFIVKELKQLKEKK